MGTAERVKKPKLGRDGQGNWSKIRSWDDFSVEKGNSGCGRRGQKRGVRLFAPHRRSLMRTAFRAV